MFYVYLIQSEIFPDRRYILVPTEPERKNLRKRHTRRARRRVFRKIEYSGFQGTRVYVGYTTDLKERLKTREGFTKDYFKIENEVNLMSQRPGHIMKNL